MRQNFGTLVIFGLFCIAGVAVAGKLNDTLATNKHEGDTLMVEIDAFLGDEAVPQKLKDALSSEIQALSGDDVEADSGLQVKGLSGGRTCCAIVPAPVAYQGTTSTTYVSYYTHTYYTACGLFWWDQCRRSKTKSRYARRYYTYTYYREGTCRDFDCCEGKMWFDGTGPCVDIPQARQMLEEAKLEVTGDL